MATFGKQFLQQMAQPSFGKGLFTTAQQIGAAPAQRKQLEAYRKMTPQQQLAYAKANAKTPKEIQAVQQQERALLQQTRADNAYNAQQKINGLVGQLSGIDPSDPKYKIIENQILTQAEAGGLNTASQQNVLTGLRNQRISENQRIEFRTTMVPEGLREQAKGMTKASMVSLMNAEAEKNRKAGAAKDWNTFLTDNPVIDASNEAEAKDLAIDAYGARGVEVVARVKVTRQAERDAARESRKRVLSVRWKSDSGVAPSLYGGATTRLSDFTIYLDEDGNIPPDTLETIQTYTDYAVSKDPTRFEFNYVPDPTTNNNISTNTNTSSGNTLGGMFPGQYVTRR
mgnify:CR=1 FL=1